MEERRRCTTVRQLELMIEFLEAHRHLALGRVRSREARAVSTRLWSECAEILNAEGPARTGKEWSKVWNDQKCRIRAKLVSIAASQRATGGGPNNAGILSPLEERVANIIGRDIGPLPNVRQDQFGLNDVDIGEGMVEEVVEELVVDDVLEGRNVSPSIVFPINESDLHQPVQEAPRPTVSPAPNVSGQSQTSTSNTRARERRRTERERASRQSTARAPAQPNRTALDESRTMILEIEKMKAEAALKTAQALGCFAESFRLIAESIDRFSQMNSRQQRGAEN